MLERYDKWLRPVCLCLGLILFAQLVRVIVRRDPLFGVNIPEVPVLASSATDAPTMDNHSGKPSSAAGTNGLATGGTNSAATNRLGINAIVGGPVGTNLVASGTNTAGTNGPIAKVAGGPGSNVLAAVESPGRPPRAGRGGMPGMGGMPGGGPPLPPLIQARIDRIIQSELLAPIVRPLPMALLGIAGTDVFLRTTSGQTGIVKEGAELGGVKVLRVGMNRVLVEENGEKKELTIFSGFGSESLLPKQNENSK